MRWLDAHEDSDEPFRPQKYDDKVTRMMMRQSLAASTSCSGLHLLPPRVASIRPSHVCGAVNEADALYKGIPVQSGIIEKRLLAKQMKKSNAEFVSAMKMADVSSTQPHVHGTSTRQSCHNAIKFPIPSSGRGAQGGAPASRDTHASRGERIVTWGEMPFAGQVPYHRAHPQEGDHDSMIDYFINTVEADLQYEVARYRPRLDADFFR